MIRKQYLVGVDNGGTMSKAGIYDLRGREIAVKSASTELITPAPGFTERDIEAFWQGTASCIKEAIEASGINPDEILGVACAGHGKGLYLWGDNKPVYNGIVSTDTRAHKYIAQWNQDGTAESVYKKTCQKILVSQPCAILRWFKDQQPEIYRQIQYVFEAKDYIRFRLTGEAYAEITDYSGTNLVNLHTRQYDSELLALFGIAEMQDKLPKLVNSLDICGYVTGQASQLTGLPEGTPVVGGMFDINACAISAGVIDEKNICAIAGTWSINEYLSKTPVIDGSVDMNTIFCLPEYYLIEESSPTSAGNLSWLAKSILNTDRQNAIEAGKNIYNVFGEIAKNILPQDSDVIFLPYIYGSQDNPTARGSFVGFSGSDGKGQMIRSVFEGVAFNHLRHINKLLVSKKHVDCIRLAGGATNSKMWVQMFADICKRPIETVASNELGTLGCAITVAAGLGEYKNISQAVENMVQYGQRVEPDEKVTGIYERKYGNFINVVESLNTIWDKQQY